MPLIDRVKNLLLQPRTEWAIIETEPRTPQELLTGYALILAAIGPLASLIGMSVFGLEVPFIGRVRTPVLDGIIPSLLTYGFSLAMLFVLSRIINWLAPTFGGRRDGGQALKLAAYGCTAVWIGGLFSLLPAFSVLGALTGLYSLYLLYTGLPVLMKSSPDRSLGYVATIVVASVIVMIPMTALFMLLNPAIQTPMVGVSADPASTETLRHLEDMTKDFERLGRGTPGP